MSEKKLELKLEPKPDTPAMSSMTRSIWAMAGSVLFVATVGLAAGDGRVSTGAAAGAAAGVEADVESQGKPAKAAGSDEKGIKKGLSSGVSRLGWAAVAAAVAVVVAVGAVVMVGRKKGSMVRGEDEVMAEDWEGGREGGRDEGIQEGREEVWEELSGGEVSAGASRLTGMSGGGPGRASDATSALAGGSSRICWSRASFCLRFSPGGRD